jgi:hypothetical protein
LCRPAWSQIADEALLRFLSVRPPLPTSIIPDPSESWCEQRYALLSIRTQNQD